MGGRNTYAAGRNVPFAFKTVGLFQDVKVLQGVGGRHNLPEEAHSSGAYAKLFKDGNPQMLRFYGKDRHLRLEIGFHAEPGLTGHRGFVYHVHEYGSDFSRSKPRFLTQEEIRKYGKYLTRKGSFR